MEKIGGSSHEFVAPRRYATDRRSTLRWIASHSMQNWYFLLLGLIGAVGNAVLASVGPVYIGRALNLLQEAAPDMRRLAQFAMIIMIAQVTRALLQWGRGVGFEMTAQRVERDIREEIFTSLIGKSMTFHSLQPVGDTMARATNDVREVNYLFSPGLNLVIGSLNFLIMPVVLAPRYHPSLILTPLIFVGLYFFSLWRYIQKLSPITDEVRRTFGGLSTRLSEALDGVETVKATAQEAQEKTRFYTKAGRYRNAEVKRGDVEAKYWPMLIFNIALAVGLLHASLLYIQNTIQLGDVVAYFGLLLLLDFPTFVSLWAYSQIASGAAGARRILEILNSEDNLDQNETGFHQPVIGAVQFENVTFAYPNSDHSLHNASFTVLPGQTVALVGQTGAGKTTLTRLINRTYDVTSGQVRVDGVDVRDWNLESLRRNISIIEQDIFLFSRSIRENIAFGNPSATFEQIQQAARMAQAEEFILTFKDGYDTVIGERGVMLSGGQRQRIALARAFLTQPAILILDDSTSAIDSNTEDKIQRAIYAASKGRTTFIITHRLSQIRWADIIIVLRRGHIAAIGSHDELMQTSDAYRRIFSEGQDEK